MDQPTIVRPTMDRRTLIKVNHIATQKTLLLIKAVIQSEFKTNSIKRQERSRSS
jgi:hypothetical protein